MSGGKHTAVPWRVAIPETGGHYPLDGEHKTEIACVPSFAFDAIDIFGPASKGDDPLPNAHLIAAAPDMLAALQNILEPTNLDIEHALLSIREIARTAISKAQGRP